eukprot:gb/GFBE01032476.1/.p1 GENE.gb/GFBE01032476.1/~~gb/GFBE01032476.1/.p1  ORF type:complete len:576 (+),score=136.67 gb/GFBE01032476.1/:1-1728(+)
MGNVLCRCVAEPDNASMSRQITPEDKALQLADEQGIERQDEEEKPDIAKEEDKELVKAASAEFTNSDTEEPRRKDDWQKPDFFLESTRSHPSKALGSIIENPCSLKDFYTQKAKIGAGKFGQVSTANIISNGAERAIKTVMKKDMLSNLNALRGEVVIMKMFDHPNTVSICEIFEDSEALFFVMKLCKGSHLQQYVENVANLNEIQSAVMMRDLLRGVAYMHNLHVCHRDLKGENLLLVTNAPPERNRLKLCDFGLSMRFSESKALHGKVGSHTHMAPEILRSPDRYTVACDNWSCGVIMYHMLVGFLPFSEEENVLNDKISYSDVHWCDVSQDACRLVDRFIDRNVETRIKAVEALEHTWLLENVQKAATASSAEAATGTTSAPTSPVSSVPPATSRAGWPARIQRFRGFNKWKQASLRVIANMLPESETAGAREIFLSLDKGCRGKVTWKDLCEAVGSEAGESDDCEKEDIAYMELLAATFEKKRALSEKMCKAAYQSFDKSGDHMVSMTDLKEGRLIGPLQPKDFQRVLKDLGEVGDDDTIDFTGFLHMLRTDRIKASRRSTTDGTSHAAGA